VSKSKGIIYPPEHYREHHWLKGEFKYIKRYLNDNRNDQQYNFLFHVFTCFLHGGSKSAIKNGLSKGWVCIPQESRLKSPATKSLRGKYWEELKERSDLLLYTEEYTFGKTNRKENKARYYYPGEKLLEIERKVTANTCLKELEKMYKPLKMEALLARCPEFKNEPDLILSAMQHVTVNIINITRMQEAFDLAWAEKENATGVYREHLELRWRSNRINFLNICAGGVDITGDTGKYTPIYRPTRTGRVMEDGGGMQNMSRDIKAAAYEGMKNYDLRASQIAALLSIFPKVACAQSLYNYVEDKELKVSMAEYVGIPVNIWKRTILSLLFGKDPDTMSELISEELAREGTSLTALELLKLYSRWFEVIQPFIEASASWKNHLSRVLCKNKVVVNAAGKQYKLPGKNRDYGFISSFFLQGMEVAYIFKVIELSNDHKYRILAHEHDGVISTNKIPKSVMESVRKSSGFKLAVLEEKPIL
jgi:hypothetical protein